MKRNFFCIFIFLFLFISCKKNDTPKQYNDFFNEICMDNSYENMVKFYTLNTLKRLDVAVKLGIVKESDKYKILPLFNSKTKVRIVSKKNLNGRINLEIIYIKHPVENMAGSKVSIIMKNENGLLKIDMGKEIKKIIERFGRGNESGYLNKKMFKY